MNTTSIDRVAAALLYEGYMLYPYRPSAIKNRQRFNFGVVYPRDYSHAQNGTEPWFMRTECLVAGNNLSTIEARVRFLQLLDRSCVERGGGPQVRNDDSIPSVPSWQEALEQEIILPPVTLQALAHEPLQHSWCESARTTQEPVLDREGKEVGVVVRSRGEIKLSIEVTAQAVSAQVFKIAVKIANMTAPSHSPLMRDEAMLQSSISTHTLLAVKDGQFISLLEPPDEIASLAQLCENVGTYPVLAGDRESRNAILSSPIILYDYPEIAPESDEDLFDGTEIDEILSLRIMTLTEEEKSEVRKGDERARRILERTENMPQEQFMKLHGILRGLRPAEGNTP